MAIISHAFSYSVLDPVFLVLYKELYYRHIYAKLVPSLEHRFESWKNYCDLFNYLLSTHPRDYCLHSSFARPDDSLSSSDNKVDLELPHQWVWDIIDEFIYQYVMRCAC